MQNNILGRIYSFPQELSEVLEQEKTFCLCKGISSVATLRKIKFFPSIFSQLLIPHKLNAEEEKTIQDIFLFFTQLLMPIFWKFNKLNIFKVCEGESLPGFSVSYPHQLSINFLWSPSCLTRMDFSALIDLAQTQRKEGGTIPPFQKLNFQKG